MKGHFPITLELVYVISFLQGGLLCEPTVIMHLLFNLNAGECTLSPDVLKYCVHLLVIFCA